MKPISPSVSFLPSFSSLREIKRRPKSWCKCQRMKSRAPFVKIKNEVRDCILTWRGWGGVNLQTPDTQPGTHTSAVWFKVQLSQLTNQITADLLHRWTCSQLMHVWRQVPLKPMASVRLLWMRSILLSLVCRWNTNRWVSVFLLNSGLKCNADKIPSAFLGSDALHCFHLLFNFSFMILKSRFWLWKQVCRAH